MFARFSGPQFGGSYQCIYVAGSDQKLPNGRAKVPPTATHVDLVAGHYLIKRKVTDVPRRHERIEVSVCLADLTPGTKEVGVPTTLFIERSWKLWKFYKFGRNKIGTLKVSVET